VVFVVGIIVGFFVWDIISQGLAVIEPVRALVKVIGFGQPISANRSLIE
jgi:hypothetical protein